jgi:hypothetical protein
MKELLRSNDRVLVSFVLSLLRDARFEPAVFDQNMSIMEGSIGALPQRVMVADEDYDAAQNLLRDAGVEVSP